MQGSVHQDSFSDDVANGHNVRTALLSAAGYMAGPQELHNRSKENSGIPSVLGIPLLALQIRQLHRAGVKEFLLEVEQVTGILTALTDELRREGIELSIIRSAADIDQKLSKADRVLIMAAGTNVNLDWLLPIMAENSDVIITLQNVDSEYSDFEIIDLHSKWSGIAITDAGLVTALGEMPEGWSLPSAFLRAAVAARTAQRQLSDAEIGRAKLQRILSQDDANILANSMLKESAEKELGAIEGAIFAPLSAALSSRYGQLMSWTGLAAAGLSICAFLCSFFAMLVPGAIAAFGALFFQIMQRQRRYFDDQRASRLGGTVSWTILAAALPLGGMQIGGSNGFFAAFVAGGLVYLAWRLSHLKEMVSLTKRYLSPSPAFLTLVVLAGGASGLLIVFLQIWSIFALLYIVWQLAIDR